MKTLPSLLAILIAHYACSGGAALGEDGVTDDLILVGQTCVLSGPTELQGRKVQNALRACFERVNINRGIKGRKIKLKSMDDEYDEKKAGAAARKLIREEKVFLLLGGVGSVPSQAAWAVCEELGVPYLGPITGAQELRLPSVRQAIHIRASYYEETEALIKYLVDKKGMEKIACFLASDSLGKSGAEGLEAALKRRGKSTAITASYERQTIAIAPALVQIAAEHPQAVIALGDFRGSSAFIKSARSHPDLKDAQLCCISVVGTASLMKELAGEGDGVIISQAVPSPWDESLPVVQEYLRDMKQIGQEERSFTSMEGYLAARFFCAVLEKMEGEPTRAKFMEALEKTGTFDLGGFELHFGPQNHNGSSKVILTVIKGSRAEKLAD